jgi:hypothetical protein
MSFQLKGMPVASGVVNRFDRVMMILCGIVSRALDVEKAFAAGAARLVDDNHRLLHQIVLGDDALDGAGHLIGAAAGARGYDEFNRANRFPGGICRDSAGAEHRDRGQRNMQNRMLHLVYSPSRLDAPFFAGFAFNPTLNSALSIRFRSSQFSSHIVRFIEAALQVRVAATIVSLTRSHSIRVFRISRNLERTLRPARDNRSNRQGGSAA